ncbi:MAG: O-antigen ligase family protein, partial [Candidatus Sumerlaeia bacterium]|nr:O-antigen ligase family protein [Candidatus Sumerlaeia bacterium]
GTFSINGASANAIVYGQLLIFTLPFGYYLFTEIRNALFKLIALGLTLFILLVSVLTLARQVMIILILQLFIIPILFKSRSSPVFLILLVIAGLLSAPYAGYKITRRLETLKTEQLRRDRSLLVRLDAIKVGKKIFAQKPLFGIGLGAFPTRWGKYAGFDTFSLHLERVDKIYPDCTYNQLISETGVVGFILAITLYLSVALIAWKKRRVALRQRNIPLANCSSIVLVLILVMLVKNFIVDTFLETRTWILFAMTMALLKPGFMEEKTAEDSKQSGEKLAKQPSE